MQSAKTAIDTKKTFGKYDKSHWGLTLMLLPGIIFVFIFSYIPMAGFVIAFKDYKFNLGVLGSEWVGFKNFEFLFQSQTFSILIRNTLGYNLAFIFLGIIVAVIVALMLDAMSKKVFIKIYQGSMFLPYFLSWIVISYISYAILEYDSGVANSIIRFFGGEGISFYSEPKYWPYILIITNIWKCVGYNALVYYGSILSIDPTLYEAATIEGCGYLGQVRYITIPHLKSTIIILMLLALGGIFRSDYGMFFYLPKDIGALYRTTDVLDTYILRSIRSTGNLGASSAVGFLQSIVGCILVVTVNAIVKKTDEESSLF